VASSVPCGCSQGVTGRAEKKPFAPQATDKLAFIWLRRLRVLSLSTGGCQAALEVTCVQNSRRRSTRCLGGLPAMMAALIAPIEIPAIQSGWMFASASPSLICAKRAAALQDQGNAFE